MSNNNLGSTALERIEAKQYIAELQSRLDSHKLSPRTALARSDCIRELARWMDYLDRLNHPVRLHAPERRRP